MTKLLRIGLLGALIAFIIAGFMVGAGAQQDPDYPPPTPKGKGKGPPPGKGNGKGKGSETAFTVENCAVVSGVPEDADGVPLIPVLGSFTVEGREGCAPGEGNVSLDGASHRFNLHPGFTAAADGSYISPVITMPSHMGVGDHRLFVIVEDRGELVRPIRVVAQGAGGGARTGGGGGGGGGRLPLTGGNILMLTLWALLLTGVGLALIRAARRGRLGMQPLRAAAVRFRPRKTQPAALPPPDVPYIDTRGFVPVRKPSASPENFTEADT